MPTVASSLGMAGASVMGRAWFSLGLVMSRLTSVMLLAVCPHPPAWALMPIGPVSPTGTSAVHFPPETVTETPLTVTGPAHCAVPATMRCRALGARCPAFACGCTYFPSVSATAALSGGLVITSVVLHPVSLIAHWLAGVACHCPVWPG